MTTRYPTQCAACLHFRGANSAGNLACDAYPGGIPNRIAYFGADHRQPSKGDHGVRFEQKPGDKAAVDFANWQYVFAPDEWREAQRGNQTASGGKGGDAA